MKLRMLVGAGDPWQHFAKYYAKTAQITPVYATRLLMMLNEPRQLAYHLQRNNDTELARHLANICDQRSPYAGAMAKIFGLPQMRIWRDTYATLASEGINFERFMNPFYTFQKIQQHNGQQSYIAQTYRDPCDFKINPQLLKALALEHCPATSSEGQALWVYTRLCSVLQYDEGYMYQERRDHPNDDPLRSFGVVEQVTPATPTTCYNFARIAVKLLNQIPGINATIIAAGKNLGHFRFGFYSDRVSADVEAINAVGPYNDLARAKLGFLPRGLRVIYGEQLVDKLLAEEVAPWLQKRPKPLSQYVSTVKKHRCLLAKQPFNLSLLLKILKQHGITGTDAVQVLLKLNTTFDQTYVIARAGRVTDQGVIPYLLVRLNDKIVAIDLANLSMKSCDQNHLRQCLTNESMVYADQEHTLGDLTK